MTSGYAAHLFGCLAEGVGSPSRPEKVEGEAEAFYTMEASDRMDWFQRILQLFGGFQITIFSDWNEVIELEPTAIRVLGAIRDSDFAEIRVIIPAFGCFD